MQQDCCFTEQGNRFRYRVGVIIVEEGCVLLAGNRNEDYLYSVGGGVRYEVERLAVIHEDFFGDNSGTLACWVAKPKTGRTFFSLRELLSILSAILMILRQIGLTVRFSA